MNLQKLEKKIIDFLKSHHKQIYKSRTLAKELFVSNRDYQIFKRVVRKLADNNRIHRYKGNRYGKVTEATSVTGIIEVKKEGYGFVRQEDGGEDVFIGRKNQGAAFHGDRVRVVIWAQPVGRLAEGKVVEILVRGKTQLLGTFTEGHPVHQVIPDDLQFAKEIQVSEKDRQNAFSGQKVFVQIVHWGDIRHNPKGKIIKVLGFPDDPNVDLLSVIYSFQLPLDFPAIVKKEAEALPKEIPDSAYQGRLDLREKCIFTIDPEDAKDFDDAVSLEKLKNGHFLLGIHISDVTYFVPSGSALDREAYKRGTSVYLPGMVIPMFPERLSSNLCSLKPGQNRLTLSVLIEMTPEGNVEEYAFHESVICSRYRLSYQDAQTLMDQRESVNISGIEPQKIKLLQDTLVEMSRLSQKLKKRFRAKGSLDFEMPEPKITLDKKGCPVQLGIRKRLPSHELIEAFMLQANRLVAEHIQKCRNEMNKKFPFIFRIHEKPKGEKLEEFIRFVRALGYSFDIGKRVTSKKFQDLLSEVKGTPHEYMVEEAAVRTMMKAIYSTRNPGHFGLAFPHYTHFTSPIRRYPDLVVHRLLKAYLLNPQIKPDLIDKLSYICEMSTEREIAAMEAEREAIRAKQVSYMARHLGDEFDGIISGVTSFGIFVEIQNMLIEGMIPLRSLDDNYALDSTHYCLIGQRKGRNFRLGHRVRVRVVRALKEMRKLDFELIET